MPATLSLKWTYEGGRDVRVVAGDRRRRRLRRRRATATCSRSISQTGKLRWKYATGNLLGESSPAVGGGLVYVGDLSASSTRCNAKDGSKAWTFKTGSEIKSSPVVTGERGADRLVRHAPLRARRGAPARSRWKLKTDGQVHATPTVVNGDRSISAAATNGSAPCAPTDGKVLFEVPLDANTGSSAVIEGNRAYLGTFNNEVVAIDLAAKKIAWRYKDPDREFPYYSSPALAGRPGVSSAAATRRSTRSTRRPARARGSS